MSAVRNPISLMSTFLWIGFVCAISFMEAWLKFQAPGITIPLGLGIGRLVFFALNKVEILFALAILISMVLENKSWMRGATIGLIIPVVILALQTFWLLPALDERAEFMLMNHPMKESSLHLYYVGFELIKVFSLTLFGISHFKLIKL